MFIKFLINFCILITYITISTLFLKEREIVGDESLIVKIIIGISSGLFGIFLIMNNANIKSDIILDFRYLPILLPAIYVGTLPALVSCFIIFVLKLFIYGTSKASLVGAFVIFLAGIGFSFISMLKASRKNKWIYCTIYLFVLILLSFSYTTNDLVTLFKPVIVYEAGYLIILYFAYKYINYFNKSFKLGKKLKYEAATDYLTGLNNVRSFNKLLKSISKMAIRKNEKLSMLYIDIDHFKTINDMFGHDSGDRILKDISKIFLSTCRAFDIISRNGGDEFTILLPGCSAHDAYEIAERIRKNVETHNFIIGNDYSIKVTVSIGISAYPEITKNIEELMKHSDSALFEAKRASRNKIHTYNLCVVNNIKNVILYPSSKSVNK